jgi:hypothetical protein
LFRLRQVWQVQQVQREQQPLVRQVQQVRRQELQLVQQLEQQLVLVLQRHLR